MLIFDARKPQTPFREFSSPLKFQSRCLSVFPDKTGFALGSIEGRVAISHVEQKDLKYSSSHCFHPPVPSPFALRLTEDVRAVPCVRKNFAFKCHRHGTNGTEVYAVNSIAFHEKYGTFATAGSDGGYVFWDKDSKQRLKLFNRMAQPITSSNFNKDGNIYAYAVGYDWSKVRAIRGSRLLPTVGMRLTRAVGAL